MAKYRPPQYCPKCGKQLKAVYRDQSNVPFMQKIIGDTFIRYAECDCIKGNKDYDKSKKAHAKEVTIPDRLAKILNEQPDKEGEQPEKLWIKIGNDLIKEFDRDLLCNEFNDIDFDGRVMIQVGYVGEKFQVTNAMNGYGHNTFDEHKDKEVTFLTEFSKSYHENKRTAATSGGEDKQDEKRFTLAEAQDIFDAGYLRGVNEAYTKQWGEDKDTGAPNKTKYFKQKFKIKL